LGAKWESLSTAERAALVNADEYFRGVIGVWRGDCSPPKPACFWRGVFTLTKNTIGPHLQSLREQALALRIGRTLWMVHKTAIPADRLRECFGDAAV
jgi:hypothetical protein